jgi:hypothetical protein
MHLLHAMALAGMLSALPVLSLPIVNVYERAEPSTISLSTTDLDDSAKDELLDFVNASANYKRRSEGRPTRSDGERSVVSDTIIDIQDPCAAVAVKGIRSNPDCITGILH